MKNILLKLIIASCCFLAFPDAGLQIHAEEGTEENTSSETADSGNEIIQSKFYVLTVQETRALEVEFNKDWFRQDARTYSHDLARLSLGLATAAFRPGKDVAKDVESGSLLSGFLRDAHFSDLRMDDYDKKPSMYTVSTVMGHQRIGEGDDAFELIAVGVCGQGYVDEWESNFTIGNGMVHEGFDRASRLVYDRVFGYIASLDLQKPCKIWMAGFSRAAAITNLTAAKLCESSMFSQDTVFAYTFATPRTVKDNDYARYKNIFNIVGNTDPVPNVPFADWGYERYGTTLYLPVPETDSDYYDKRTRANVVYKDLTGIDYWYNSESDSILKIILSYCLELSPTADIYASSLQNKLIRIWDDRTPVNVAMSILDLANDPVLINESTREHANILLNYLSSFAMSFANASSVFRHWNPTASVGGNILQAHTPELYVSWVYSVDDGDELYTENDEYVELYISTDEDVSLIKDGKVIETIKAIPMENDDYKAWKKKMQNAETPENNIYLCYDDDGIKCTLPRDSDFSLYIPGNAEGNNISAFVLDYSTKHQTPENACYFSYVLFEKDGMTVSLVPDSPPEISTDLPVNEERLDYFQDLDLDISDVVFVTKPEATSLPWRTVAILTIGAFFLVVTLIMFQITYLIGEIRLRGMIRNGWLPKGSTFRKLPTFCMYTIFLLFMMKEFMNVLYPELQYPGVFLKLAIGFLALITAYSGYRKTKDDLSGRIIIALMLLTAADIAISFNILTGACLYIASYLLLGYAYCRQEKPVRGQIIAGSIMGIIALCFMVSVKGQYGLLRLMGILYMGAALFMVTASFSLQRRIFIGSLLLFAAGCMLMYNYIHGQTFLSHIVSLGTYYVALSLIASANNRIEIPPAIPEDSQEPAPAR